MNKLVQSAANSQPARLPAIVVPQTIDPALRQTLEAIKERLEVRDGARGNPYERGLTVRDLVDAGVDVTLVGQRVTPKPVVRKAPSSGGLGSESGSLPASIEALIRKSLTAEASRLGAHIQRVEHRLQTESESQASVVQQLTAAIGQASAGVRQVSYANATANRSTAGLITQLAAALDGTGSATLEESMVVIADRTEGLRSQYMLKLGAGNAVTGISLLASEDPTGATESAFIVQADRFQVKTVGGAKTPFGIDGSNIYLDGTVRINAGGQTLSTLATNAAVPAITYIGEFASAPATGTLKKNNVYRNSSNGNTYILSADAGVWQLYLEKGATGTPGAAGQRGSVTLYRTGTWSDSGAASAISAATGTGPVIGDTVTYYNSTTATTKYWSGSTTGWADPGVVINGNLLVSGTVSSSAIGTNTLSAVNIDTTGRIKAEGNSVAYAGYPQYRGAIFGVNASLDGNTDYRKGVVGYSLGGAGVSGLGDSGPTGTYGSAIGVQGVGHAGGDFRSNTVNGMGVYGQGQTAGLFVSDATNGVGVSCSASGASSASLRIVGSGRVQWSSYTYSPPDGTANKYLSAGGTWRRPALSDIEPNNADTPTFQFSTDNGATWTAIRLKRL